MKFDNISMERKRALDAIAVALIGWIWYALIQIGMQNSVIGFFIDFIYLFFKYMLMPFAFSGLLLAIVVYAINRSRGLCSRDMIAVVLLLVALALAFYVTAPVMGEIAIVICTAVFLIFRLIRRFR